MMSKIEYQRILDAISGLQAQIVAVAEKVAEIEDQMCETKSDSHRQTWCAGVVGKRKDGE